MAAPNPYIHEFFFKTALEYYVNGRGACLSGCLFTSGNLLHHAVEMMLKGELSKTIAIEELKDSKRFGHWLPKCWDAFKSLFPSEYLSEFDPMIVELDKFESIRYPDNLLKFGASIGFGFGRGRVINTVMTTHPVREYQMAIGDVDAFFAKTIRLCRMNPEAYFLFLTEQGREVLRKYNDYSEGWFR